MRRAVLALSAAAVLGGAALPSLAQTLPVGVTTDTKGGVTVGTTVNGQPGVGASVRDGQACVAASLQLPVCADLPGVSR